MKLATKTMLSFIAVIVFQAGLTISVLSYFVHKQNEEIVMDEMKKEASVVLDNYMAWKTQLWKNLITLKSNQVLADYTKRLYRETSEERMKTLLVDIVNNTKELLITSGIDFVVIKTDKQLVIRSISNSQLMFSNLFLKLDQKSLPYPYLENMVLDGNLTLTGIINLGTDLTFNMNIYLIKVIDQQFVNKLSKHHQAKLFFYNKDRYLQAEINEIRVGTVIPFERLSYTYNVLTNLTFDEEPFSGIVKKLELDERILQAEKLSSISMLSAGVTHEINNPLSSIMSNVHNLMEEETNPAKSAALNWIRQETRRIGDIVKRLLDFAASHHPGETDTDVNEEIRQVVDLIRFSVKQKIVIEHQLDDSIPRTKINQTEFKQVIINLLTNSVQACHDSGAILIRTSAAADKKSIRISIGDTGEGMPGEIIPRIFNPFFTTKPTGIGTGLGLSVVYGIVKNHQGEIRVESSPGQGSTFIITIPAMEDKR